MEKKKQSDSLALFIALITKKVVLVRLQVSDKYKFILIVVYKDASRTFMEVAEPLGKSYDS